MTRAPKNVRNFLARAGRKGGKARKKTTTPEQRQAIARKAAQARWARRPSA